MLLSFLKLLLNTKTDSSRGLWLAACIYLMLSSLGGAYLLFHYLARQLGSDQAGLILCGIFAVVGFVLLGIRRWRQTKSRFPFTPLLTENLGQEINSLMHEILGSSFFKKLSHYFSKQNVIVIAIAVGFVLTQRLLAKHPQK